MSIFPVIDPPRAPPPPRVERSDDGVIEVPLPLPHLPAMPAEAAPTSAVSGAGLAEGPALIERPRWVRRPAGLDRYYPRRARETGMEGVVQTPLPGFR